jgi:glycosyltransferase involved in cell wall biosynthesis
MATSTAYLPSTGGAQIQTHNVLKLIKAKGHEIRVVSQWDANRSDWLLGSTLLSPWKEKEYAHEGIPVRNLAFSLGERAGMAPFVFPFYATQGISIPILARAFFKKLKREGDDWDVYHTARMGRENIAFATLEMARSNGKPFVLTPYHHPRWVGFPYHHYCKLYRDADHIIAMTEAEKRILATLGVRPEAITVTGTGPVLSGSSDPIGLARKLGIPAGAPVVLFLGQKFTYKGFREVYSAMPLVLKKYPETHFLFVGPPSPDSIRFFKDKRHPNFREMGRIGLEEKCSALGLCDVLCVPSSQESFGGVYTEAWSFGKPVIGCNIPAVSEVISNGTDGFLCEQDPGQIAERILFYLGNASIALEHGKAGQKKVAQKYAWGILAEKTLAAFQAAVKS